jgi:DsbC/DsbD-like thiol-disulfide interchange protein
MVMQEGWHIYGPEVGEFGLPTSFELRSEEFELLQSEISWPQEQPFEQLGGIQSSGYGGELELVLPLRCLPQDLLLQPHQGGGAAEQGELVLRWLACSASSCVPGEARMTLGPQ